MLSCRSFPATIDGVLTVPSNGVGAHLFIHSFSLSPEPGSLQTLTYLNNACSGFAPLALPPFLCLIFKNFKSQAMTIIKQFPAGEPESSHDTKSGAGADQKHDQDLIFDGIHG